MKIDPYLSEFLNFKYQCDVRVFGEIYGDLRYIYIDSIFGYKGGYFYKTFIFFFFLGEFVTTHSIINAITDFHANQ